MSLGLKVRAKDTFGPYIFKWEMALYAGSLYVDPYVSENVQIAFEGNTNSATIDPVAVGMPRNIGEDSYGL